MIWWDRFLARVMPEKPNADRVVVFGRSTSGQYVDEDTALRYAVVWGCVNVIAKAVSILPWGAFQRTRTGRRPMPDHPVDWLLHYQPNPEMSPSQFKHTLVTHVLTWGNAYCEIERDGMGRPVWLWPITPDRVMPQRDAAGAITYRVRNPGHGDSILPASVVMHVRGMGFDGLVGYSPIRMAAESIGLGLAMQDFGATFFGNGANMGGVLMHPKTLSDTARKNLEESLQKRAGGRNSNRWLVAEEGMKPERIGIPPDEAQFLESRKHQVLDICRWYGVPPHKLAALDRATWNNIEHQALEFVTDTIQPWVTQFEEEANLKLFGRQQRGVFYTKFNLSALLRGDVKTRFEAYEIGHRNGWLSANDIRALEDMNPIPNGSMYVMQGQMVTREQVKAGKQQPASDGQDLPIQEGPVESALRAGRVLNATRKT